MNQEQATEVKVFTRLLYEIQKTRIEISNRLLAKEREGQIITKRMRSVYEHLETLEKKTEGVLKEIVDATPIWAQWMKDRKGIGAKMAGSLIAEILDISKFDTVSSLWAYFGLTSQYVLAECDKGHKIIMASDKHKTCPVLESDTGERCGGIITIIERVEGKAPKRKRGYHYLFNSRGKTLAWKIGQQFLKQGEDVYRQIYYKQKQKEKQKNPDISDGHAHNRALRKMVKIFLSHLWVEWRTIESLPVREPYAMEYLGHTSKIVNQGARS
ncbi:MAG: hypothetical protein A4E65_03104 [Syntrophorhabdus sp. PtaU1.Bin153]|nr:MAG: hypothetical protein A4E65_03104 [Syntrophorhabdus sp. PtaU1.Bin153]